MEYSYGEASVYQGIKQRVLFMAKAEKSLKGTVVESSKGIFEIGSV